MNRRLLSFSFILGLAVRWNCSEGLFSPLCDKTQICHNCYISTLGEFGCVQTLVSMYGQFSEQQCIEALWNDPSLIGVDYDPVTHRCRGYFCDYGLGYTPTARTVYRKTCNTECYEITFTKESGQMIDLTVERSDNHTEEKSYLHTCFRWACETTPHLCSAAFDSVEDYCYKFTSCVPFCSTVANSSWDILTKICHDGIDCGPPDGVLNGYVTYNGTTYADIASYACNNGYLWSNMTSDTVSRRCGRYGNWSDYVPVCEPVSCGNPEAIDNGSVTEINGTTFGDTATYECTVGFLAKGTTTITCREDGNWSSSVPSCVPVDCGQLLNPENGFVVYETGYTLYGHTVQYSCGPNYTLNGPVNRTCTENGYWSDTEPECLAPDCGELADPQNGHVNTSFGTKHGDVAFYTCDGGYELTGPASRLCLSNATWEGYPPSCTLVDCGEPVAPANGNVSTPYGTTYGRLAIVDCAAGFSAGSNVYRKCLDSGQWSEPAPSCTEVVIATTTPEPPRMSYIMPCTCLTNITVTITNLTREEDIILVLIESTRIDVSNTSLNVYRHKSRDDPRRSSTLIGYGVVAFMSLVFGLMFCLDILTFYQQGGIFKSRTSKYAT